MNKSDFKGIKVMATALKELRGLDGHMIHELEDKAGDAVSQCILIAAVLDGFLAAPSDVQNAILSAGVAPKNMHKSIFLVAMEQMMAERKKELLSKLETGWTGK